MKQNKTQYTIRGIPSDVDQALRHVAEARRVSLNAYLVQELSNIAEQAKESGLHHDLDFAIGTMTDGQLVDEALKMFNRVDSELWQ
ncbi:MAG: hypothetical protein P4L46_13835 [Fimbriimonas sp.]|nr:hypothetical protein [Fimbriimonas sp.]